MATSGCNTTDEPGGTGLASGPVWAGLAAAAAVGLWVARHHPKTSVALGLGFALWRCCVGNDVCEADDQTTNKSVCRNEDKEQTQREDEPKGQGEWILNLEPVPLVVSDEILPLKGHGQGDGLLDQGPGQAVEELDWLPPVIVEETWLNEGVEIPDTVELPELEDPNRNARNHW